MDLLEPITDYQMDELQAKAYKVGLLWQFYSRQMFPNYTHDRGYPRKRDPRKSRLFQFCYKLVRETQGLIPDEEYSLYVKAQLQILAHINVGDGHPMIGPFCLAGDKAWVRWKIWKKKYDVQFKNTTKAELDLEKTPLKAVCEELDKTKAYLFGKFGGQPKEQDIMMGARDMERWIGLEKVSGYYAVLSPWVKKYCKNITIDLSLFQTTLEMENYFRQIFDYEKILH